MTFKKSLLTDLKTLQTRLIESGKLPETASESLTQLAKFATQASTIEKTPDTESSLQYLLSQLVTQLLASLIHLEMDLGAVVSEALENLAESKAETIAAQNRIILVYASHAELLVDGEVRGTIPVYDRCDQDELRNIAKLFQCELKFAESEQLGIFAEPGESPEKETLAEQIADRHIENEIQQLSLINLPAAESSKYA